MRYRRFGRLDWQVSALGFGCMRLPTRGDEGQIDEAEAVRIVRYAIDHGLNYIDTAYGYHGGKSEIVVGKILQDGYRQKVRLATKLPMWLLKAPEDCDRFLNEQLQKLQTDRVDFYLLHALGAESWKKTLEFRVLDWAERAMADGRIGHLGFSFHDRYPVFKEIVDGYDRWTFCQIQYNYMDIEEQAGAEGLRYAADKGLAVVIMEPLLGGRLASAPAAVQALWDTASRKRTPADWALQWLWNQPEVTTVLSGMSNMEQVQQNLASADASGVGTLSADEMALVAKVRAQYRELCPIPCTACSYCMPCPSGVNIPHVFRLFNGGRIYEKVEDAREGYMHWTDEAERANNCTACRQCESLCPQHIEISAWMPKVHAVLGEGQGYQECLAAGLA
ncbi:MAG: aldo/keto reductase [Anaerolineae bacterium]